MCGVACATYLSHDLPIDPLGQPRASQVLIKGHQLGGSNGACSPPSRPMLNLRCQVLLSLLFVEKLAQLDEVLLI